MRRSFTLLPAPTLLTLPRTSGRENNRALSMFTRRRGTAFRKRVSLFTSCQPARTATFRRIENETSKRPSPPVLTLLILRPLPDSKILIQRLPPAGVARPHSVTSPPTGTTFG